MATTISKKGLATLEYLEGTVLKAYRDVAGVWTIGAGLTKASGVVTPKAGMVITAQQSSQLLNDALTRNYIPSVLKVMGNSQGQNVLDGAVSFQFNTGAIARASWVKEFKVGNYAGARAKLYAWNKAGGKVVKGLSRRRQIEADIIINKKYPDAIEKKFPANDLTYAILIAPLDLSDIKAVQKDFESLGYRVTFADKFLRTEIERFQKDHDLTIDAMIGTATLATLQRQIDARKKAKTGSVVAAGGGAVNVGGDALTNGQANDWTFIIGGGVALIAIIYLGYIAYNYRDSIAAALNPFAPKIAKWLWSF